MQEISNLFKVEEKLICYTSIQLKRMDHNFYIHQNFPFVKPNSTIPLRFISKVNAQKPGFDNNFLIPESSGPQNFFAILSL